MSSAIGGDRADGRVELDPAWTDAAGACAPGAGRDDPGEPDLGEASDLLSQLAERGTRGAADPFPHAAAIEAAFGHAPPRARLGGRAADACATMATEAFAWGDAVGFASAAPSLHVAAHEAAHVAGADERLADRAADRVVAGQPAAHLFAGLPRGSASVQLYGGGHEPAAAPHAPAPAAAAPKPFDAVADARATLAEDLRDAGAALAEIPALAMRASMAQATGDWAGYRAAAQQAAHRAAKGPDLFLTWYPDNIKSLREGGADAAAVQSIATPAFAMSSQLQRVRDALGAMLTPQSFGGKPTKLPVPMSGGGTIEAYILACEAKVEPLFAAAESLRAMAAAGVSVAPDHVAGEALRVTSGPFARVASRGGDFDYLYAVFETYYPPSEVKRKVQWLLGKDAVQGLPGLGARAQYAGMLAPGAAAPASAAGAPTAPAGAPGGPYASGFGDDEGVSYPEPSGGPQCTGEEPPRADDGQYLGHAAMAARGKGAAGSTLGGYDSSAPLAPWKQPAAPGDEEQEAKDPDLVRDAPAAGTFHDASGKLTIGKNSATVSGGATRRQIRDDGPHDTLAANAEVTAGERLEGHAGVAGERKRQDGSVTRGSAEAGRDEHGGYLQGSAGVASEKDGHGRVRETGMTARVDQERATLGGQHAVVQEHADGTKDKQGGGLQLSTDGSMSGNATTSHTDKAGNTTSMTGRAGYDAKTGQVDFSAGRATVDKEGETTRSISGGGHLDLTGPERGAGAHVEASHGPVKGHVKMGYSIKVSPPVEKDGRFQVAWERTYQGEAGAGLEHAKGGKGVGVSGSISAGKTDKGTRVFATAADAQAFYDSGDLGDTGMPGSADAARNLAEGTEVAQDRTMGKSIDGEVSYGPLGAGAGYQTEDTRFSSMTRGEKGILRLEVGTSALRGHHLSGRVGVASLGTGHSRTEVQSHTVEFDLDTAAGRAAFDAYQRTGQVPNEGCRLVEVGEGESNSDTFNLGLLGMAYGDTSTVATSNTNSWDKAGMRHTQERESGTDTTSLSIPLLGSYSSAHALRMLQVDDGAALYEMESVISGGDSDSIKAGLYDAVGSGRRYNDHEAGGTYRVQSALSQKDVDHFVDQVKGDGYLQGLNTSGGLHAHDGTEELRAQLVAAGDDVDKQRLALAHWVADNGASALQHIRALTTGEDSKFFVEKDGDPYLTGTKGQLDLELRMQGYGDRLRAGDRSPELKGKLRADLQHEREKLAKVPEHEELPPKLQEQELRRTRDNLHRLDELYREAMTEGVDDGNGTSVAADPGEAIIGNTEVALDQEAVRTSTAHGKAVWAQGKLAASFGNGSIPGDFARADGRYGEAVQAFSAAERQRAEAKDALAAYKDADHASVDPEAMAMVLVRARSLYARAGERYDAAAELDGTIADERFRG